MAARQASAGSSRRALDDLDPFDPVDLRLLEDRLQALGFAVFGGDHELAGFAVRHAMRRAEVVEHPS
jgi:hypothetical protein